MAFVINFLTLQNILYIFRQFIIQLIIGICLEGRVFINGPGGRGTFPGRVIPKTLKMVLDTAFLNTKQYKVRIKSKVEESWKRSSAPKHLAVVAIEKEAFWSSSTTVAKFLRSFHNSISWWFLTGIWVTTSLLKSPGLFSVFWPI